MLIHADAGGAKKRIETFVVGMDLAAGEKAVWVVEGGKYKASFLLDTHTGADTGAETDKGKGKDEARLLISEVSYYYYYFSFLFFSKFPSSRFLDSVCLRHGQGKQC